MNPEELLDELEWEADLPLGETLRPHSEPSSSIPQHGPSATQSAKRQRSDRTNVSFLPIQPATAPATDARTALPLADDPPSPIHSIDEAHAHIDLGASPDLNGSDDGFWEAGCGTPETCGHNHTDDARSTSSSDVSHDDWAHDDGLDGLYEEHPTFQQTTEPTDKQRKWHDRQQKAFAEFAEERPRLMATHIASLGPPEGALCRQCAAAVAVVGCADCSLDGCTTLLLCADCDHAQHPTAHYHHRCELQNGTFAPIPSYVMFKPVEPGKHQHIRVQQRTPKQVVTMASQYTHEVALQLSSLISSQITARAVAASTSFLTHPSPLSRR